VGKSGGGADGNNINSNKWQPPSPLSVSYTPTGDSAARHHIRTKSIERDNKTSPHKASWAQQDRGLPERDSAVKQGRAGLGSSAGGYQGMMGTHLTTNENNK